MEEIYTESDSLNSYLREEWTMLRLIADRAYCGGRRHSHWLSLWSSHPSSTLCLIFCFET